MQWFYHAYTDKYIKRCRNFLLLTAVPLWLIALLAAISLILNFRNSDDGSFAAFFAVIAAVCVLMSMLICFLAYEFTERAVKRNARYTYFDIALREMIFSRYAGEYVIFGERKINRSLYVIPFCNLTAITYKRKKHILIFKGKIRRYDAESERLGYHIVDGKLIFDNWWLNESGYTELDSVTIPDIFEKPKKVMKSVAAAKKRFDEIPPPAPRQFKEAGFIRRRPIERVLPDNPVFKRKW